jgi:ADP-ribosylglycohydrolase
MAVGDALGAPLEGLTSQQIKSHYGRVRTYVDGQRAWKRKPHRWRLPGLYSDDTQQALVLCDVLLEQGRIDQERVADLYVALATPKGSFEGAHRGIGKSFRQVLLALEHGVPIHRAAQETAGIGAAMRIAPIPLYFRNEVTPMFESVMAASLMTHRDIRSITGALAVAHAIRRLAQEEPRCEPALLLWLAADLVRHEEQIDLEYSHRVTKLCRHARAMSLAIAHAESVVENPRERALQSLLDEANRHGADPACKRATQGFPPACIPTCLYFLVTTGSFEEALTDVINLGGDTDTNGAILGAMAGAYYGIHGIPETWLDGLQNREGIELRARALDRRRGDGLNIPELVATEHELTRKEGEMFETILSCAQGGGESGGADLL